MMCPYCGIDKPVWAPKCHSCLSDVSFTLHVIFEIVRFIFTMVFFFGSLALLFAIFGD